MKRKKLLLTCHCCGEQRRMNADVCEGRFYEVERNTIVFIRTFPQHDHERAEKQLAVAWKMTLEEFKAKRYNTTWA